MQQAKRIRQGYEDKKSGYKPTALPKKKQMEAFINEAVRRFLSGEKTGQLKRAREEVHELNALSTMPINEHSLKSFEELSLEDGEHSMHE